MDITNFGASIASKNRLEITMQYLPNSINDYVFGDRSGAGIGCITGDAGCEVQSMSRDEFISTVLDYLGEEDPDTAELRAELNDEADELYAEFLERFELDNNSCTHVVAIDKLSYIVFGFGVDYDECYAEAEEWCDKPSSLTFYEATEAAYTYAKLNGGDSRIEMFRIEDDRIYLA